MQKHCHFSSKASRPYQLCPRASMPVISTVIYLAWEVYDRPTNSNIPKISSTVYKKRVAPSIQIPCYLIIVFSEPKAKWYPQQVIGMKNTFYLAINTGNPSAGKNLLVVLSSHFLGFLSLTNILRITWYIRYKDLSKICLYTFMGRIMKKK